MMNWTSAVVCWRIDGPAGTMLDTLVAACIDAGHEIEVISPTTAYRLTGEHARLQALAEQVGTLDGFSMAVEQPPEGVVNLVSTLAPQRPWRRSVTVHGRDGAYPLVARAVDMRLQVVAVGPCRWTVRGRTAELLAWGSLHAHRVSVDEVLALWGLTVDSARAEDVDLPPIPVIKVQLPTRVRTTKIKRDDDGQLVDVEQLETDAPDE